MNFGDCIKELKLGQDMRRRNWNGKGMNIYLVVPITKGRLPYIEMTTVQGELVPWSASQTDILADDWEFAR